jgi:lipoprotein
MRQQPAREENVTAYAQLFASACWHAMVVSFSWQSRFLWSQASGEAGFRQQIITDEKFSLEQQLPVCVTVLQRIWKKWKFMCHGLQPGYRPLQGWKKPRLNRRPAGKASYACMPDMAAHLPRQLSCRPHTVRGRRI